MNEVQAVLFDLDGTIYEGDRLSDGAKQTIDHLHAQQKWIAFLTNNSTKTRRKIQEKLNGLGIEIELNRIYTSAFATAEYLSAERIMSVYCLGTPSFVEELRGQGVEVVTDASADCVVIGMTREVGQEKLSVIREIADKPNSRLIACNLDWSYPDGSG